MGTTIVTGASSGLGRGLALRLAADGEPVALLARRKDLLDELADQIERSGGRALAVCCDVTDADSVREGVRAAEQHFGGTTRLIANAGGPAATDVDAFCSDHVTALMEQNLMGVVRCIEAVLPGMLQRGEGHIVATGSLAGYRGLPRSAAYCASKAALTALMEGLRVDLRPRGIDVTVVCPGFVRVRADSARRKRNRPFRMELEPATDRMYRAICQRRSYYAFPASLVALAWLGRMLPPAVFDRIVGGRGPKLAAERRATP